MPPSPIHKTDRRKEQGCALSSGGVNRMMFSGFLKGKSQCGSFIYNGLKLGNHSFERVCVGGGGFEKLIRLGHLQKETQCGFCRTACRWRTNGSESCGHQVMWRLWPQGSVGPGILSGRELTGVWICPAFDTQHWRERGRGEGEKGGERGVFFFNDIWSNFAKGPEWWLSG